MQFEHRQSCSPYALTYAFQESFDECCARILKAGGNYQRPSIKVLEKVISTKLGREPLKKEQPYENDRVVNLFKWAKRKKGTWVVVSKTDTMPSSHLVTVKDHEILDNGHSIGFDFLPQVVQYAWQLEAA